MKFIKRLLKVVLSVTLALALVAIVGGGIYAWRTFNTMQEGAEVIVVQTNPPEEALGPGATPAPHNADITNPNPDANAKADDWYHILLLGRDGRTENETGRTDTMIIASINLSTGKIKLSSLMRDTMVQIPGKSAKEKLNTAYHYGGVQLTVQTIYDNFGIALDKYIAVDFDSFADIVDAIGGVQIDVLPAEKTEINNIIKYTYTKPDSYYLKKSGENLLLNGAQALTFARIRHSDSDYHRTSRQRVLLMAIGKKLISITGNPVKVLQVANSLMDHIETNIGILDIVKIGTSKVTGRIGDMEQLNLPIEGTFKDQVRDGTWGIYIDSDEDYLKNAAALNDFIYKGKD